MGIVIRVLYNNQGWQAPCKTPGTRNTPNRDSLCWLCFRGNVNIRMPSLDNEDCDGHCWEQHICTEYRWGCTPKGKIFGSRVYPGMKVFLIYKQPDGNYTLWGKTTVSSVDKSISGGDREDEAGFSFIHFDAFEPLPGEKWVPNLSDIQLVGEKWLQGRYRYVKDEREAYLEGLTEGASIENQTTIIREPLHVSNTNLNINISPNIYEKLQIVADVEGRQIDEIVRESIAEWLRSRN